jgi:hypothetical protein
VAAVDAQEQISRGLSRLEGPDYELDGPAGLVRCTEDKLAGYKTQGYKVVKELRTAPDQPAKVAMTENPDPSADELRKRTEADAKARTTALMRYPTEDLRRFAKDLSVEIPANANKAAMVDALVAAGFDPDAKTKE